MRRRSIAEAGQQSTATPASVGEEKLFNYIHLSNFCLFYFDPFPFRNIIYRAVNGRLILASNRIASKNNRKHFARWGETMEGSRTIVRKNGEVRNQYDRGNDDVWYSSPIRDSSKNFFLWNIMHKTCVKIVKIFQNSIAEEYTIFRTGDNFLLKRAGIRKSWWTKKS